MVPVEAKEIGGGIETGNESSHVMSANESIFQFRRSVRSREKKQTHMLLNHYSQMKLNKFSKQSYKYKH